MPRLEWTYELPPVGAPAAGLEEYVVVGSDGEPVGKVFEVLRHEGVLWLVVETGTPPVQHHRKVVSWDHIREVDHDTLTVVLGLRSDELESVPELDPENGVEPMGEEPRDVEAIRVAELPDPLRPRAQPSGPQSGPVDRPTYAVAVFVGALGLFALLVGVLVVATVDESWALAVFAAPAFLLAASAVVAYRAWRLPYEPG